MELSFNKTLAFNNDANAIVIVPGTPSINPFQVTIQDNNLNSFWILAAHLVTYIYDDNGAAARIPLTEDNNILRSYLIITSTAVIGDNFGMTVAPALPNRNIMAVDSKYNPLFYPVFFEGTVFVFVVHIIVSNSYIPVGTIRGVYFLTITIGFGGAADKEIKVQNLLESAIDPKNVKSGY